MKQQTRLLVCVGAFAVAVAAACIIPDKDIVVIVDNCGSEWVATTAGAQGYDGLEVLQNIKTTEGKWIKKTFCLTPEQDALLTDTNSWFYEEVHDDIVAVCHARALELSLGDDNCDAVATIAYVGTCYNSGGCNEGGGDDADGGAETGDQLSFEELDLTTEVDLVSGIYVVSPTLIETAIADPVGVSNDGTTLTQLRDVTGDPYGFEVDGVTSTNLGGVLGFQNGDIITEVSNQPTETYDDLLDVAAILLSSSTATVELTRGTASVTLTYTRGS